MKEFWVEINIADWIEAETEEEAIEIAKSYIDNVDIYVQETTNEDLD